MSLAKEAGSGIKLKVSQPTQAMSEGRAAGFQAWLKFYRKGEDASRPTQIPTQVHGVEFSGSSHLLAFSRFISQISGEKLEQGRSRSLVFPEGPGSEEVDGREVVVWRRKDKAYQAKVIVKGVAELKCRGSRWQACQGAVDLLFLPVDFLKKVRASQGGLLLVVTNRWFDMSTDPAETPFLEVSRLEVLERRNRSPVIKLKPVNGSEEKREALNEGGRILVVARDNFPPLPEYSTAQEPDLQPQPEAKPLAKEIDWPAREDKWLRGYQELSEAEQASFESFCQEYGIELIWSLQSYFLALAAYHSRPFSSQSGERRDSTALWRYDFILSGVFVRAEIEGIINLAELEASKKSQSLAGFWTDEQVGKFIVWLREKDSPEAFQEAA